MSQSNAGFRSAVFATATPRQANIGPTSFGLPKDQQNRLWVGTHSNGVYIFDEDGNELVFPVKNEELLLRNTGQTVFIHETAKGDMWIYTFFKEFPLLRSKRNIMQRNTSVKLKRLSHVS